jgi:hypothetical protein
LLSAGNAIFLSAESKARQLQAMLNWQDSTRLITLPIGALSGIASAHDMKAGASVIILFAFLGLLLGLAMSWLSFKFERRYLLRGEHPFVGFAMPVVWICGAGISPVCLAQILLHR